MFVLFVRSSGAVFVAALWENRTATHANSISSIIHTHPTILITEYSFKSTAYSARTAKSKNTDSTEINFRIQRAEIGTPNLYESLYIPIYIK
jgi:hypothetical protein